jgi:hypothetical protein
MEKKRIVRLVVKNLSQQKREVDLAHPGQTGMRFSLAPGGLYQLP